MPALALPVIAIVAAIAAVATMAGRIRFRGAPLGAVGVLLSASLLSAVTAAIGLPTADARDIAVSGMSWCLASSLLAMGLSCAGEMLRGRSVQVVGMAIVLVLVESGIPYAAGHVLGWTATETGAMASNAAAAVSVLASHPDLRSDSSFWTAFGIRYLVQMILPMVLLGYYLRSQKAVGHHTRASRVYAKALAIADAADRKEHELDATRSCSLAAILAIAEVLRVDRGGATLSPSDIAGDIVPGDAIVIVAGRAARGRVAELVGHHDRRWAWPVAAVTVLALLYVLHWRGHVSAPVAALIAAVATGAISGALLPAPAMRFLRRWGLIGFLTSTGIALGAQCVGVPIAPLIQYGLVAIVTTCALWWGAIWLGKVLLPGSPKMRALGCLAGSTTSSGLAESIASRTGSDVAVVAFAAAYPLSSIAKVIIVNAIIATGSAG